MFDVVQIHSDITLSVNTTYVFEFDLQDEITAQLPLGAIDQDEIIIYAPQIGDESNKNFKQKKLEIKAIAPHYILKNEFITLIYPDTYIKLVFINNNWYNFDAIENNTNIDSSIDFENLIKNNNLYEVISHLNNITDQNTFSFSIGTVNAGNLTNVLRNSGTERSVILDLSLPYPLTTKGDIWTYNNSENTKLAVGQEGQILSVNSITDTGLKWIDQNTFSFSIGTVNVGNLTNVLRNSGTETSVVLDLSLPYPLTTKGDIWTYSSSGNTRLVIGEEGQILSVNSTSDTGLKWIDQNNFSFSIGTVSVGNLTNVLRNSGTETSVVLDLSLPYPLTTKGDIWTYSSSGNTRLAIGQAGQILSVNSTSDTGLKWIDPPIFGDVVSYNIGSGPNNVILLNEDGQIPADIDASLLSIDISQITNYNDDIQEFAVKSTNYTINQDDHKKWIKCTTNLTITLPTGLLNGTQLIIDSYTANNITIEPAAGLTLVGQGITNNSASITIQYGLVHCVYYNNEWRLTGEYTG